MWTSWTVTASTLPTGGVCRRSYTLPSVDRADVCPTGKSDPFVVFHLNGQRVFKSQTKKKTLNPEWNENFTAQVVSHYWMLLLMVVD